MLRFAAYVIGRRLRSSQLNRLTIPKDDHNPLEERIGPLVLSHSEFLSHLVELIIEPTRLIHYSNDGDDIEQILQSIQRILADPLCRTCVAVLYLETLCTGKNGGSL